MERMIKKARKVMAQNVADDMILEILLRLPNKSSYRFRCVCKLWSALLCPHINQKLLLLFNEHCSIFNCYREPSDSNDNIATAMVRAETTKFKDSPILSLVLAKAWIVTSCDSYLLLYMNDIDKLCLFNPSSKGYKFFEPYRNDKHWNHRYGICYVRSTKDYKVVCLVMNGHGIYSTIFSVGSNSWTKARFVMDSVSFIQFDPVSLSGASHWVCSHTYDSYDILRFDLKDEVEQMPQPESSGRRFSLAALRGNLCAYYYLFTGFSVWEMKQYGVAESWTQVCQIDIQAGFLKPLAFISKSEMLIATNKKGLIICNVDSSITMRFEQYRGHNNMATYEDRSITFNYESWCNKGSIPSTEHFEDEEEE